ncbi:hypothetical protein [Lewinella sp. W8]|uniref:hypothetical protein n=1 Tax=Lewinella sp. W8 TaxID=2528208 RepID=UPI00106899FF|nr:hypothetical protein [Lewinella sp. W8]MTB51104.1 hypothetical protein [Lewinella sp. W8]
MQTPSPKRQRSRLRWSFWAQVLVFVVIALTSLIRNEVFRGTTNVINWDGYGYYAYLPGIFIYGDIEQYAFAEQHFVDYDISGGIYQLMETDNGRRFPIYNIGLSVLWTPAFLLTHGLTVALGLAPADGMSYPYQLMVVLMSLLFAWLGLRYLRRFLAHYVSDTVVALVLLGLGLGTNYFYYTVEGPDMTHTYLFTGYTAFLYYLHRAYRSDTELAWRPLLFCGGIAGLMCLVRSSEIVLFALPALYGLKDRHTLWRNFRGSLVIFGLALAVFSVQLIYYKIGTGVWWRDGYAGLGFDWLEPHLYEGFFSYRRGWLVYTPLMALALLGIGWLRRGWLLPVLLFTLANCYLLFSWHIWWYGNTFGSRPVVQSYAVLALPLAMLLAWVLGWRSSAERRSKFVGRPENDSGFRFEDRGLSGESTQGRPTSQSTAAPGRLGGRPDQDPSQAVPSTPEGVSPIQSFPHSVIQSFRPSILQSLQRSAGAKSPQKAKSLRFLSLSLLLGFVILLNLFQHWQYNQRILPLDFVNRTYYWHVFGQTTLDKKDYVYLDTNEKPPGTAPTTTLPLGQLDTLTPVPPKARQEFTNLLKYRVDSVPPGEAWLHATLHYAYFGDTYDKWKFPSVVTEVRRNGETLKWLQVNIPRTMDAPEGDSLSFAVSLPPLELGDEVKQYVWNLSRDSMVVREYGGTMWTY